MKTLAKTLLVSTISLIAFNSQAAKLEKIEPVTLEINNKALIKQTIEASLIENIDVIELELPVIKLAVDTISTDNKLLAKADSKSKLNNAEATE